MPIHLSGKATNNELNLTGKTANYSSNIPLEIKNIKIQIMNNIIFPLFSKNWNILKENYFLVDNYKRKIDFYYDSYKLNDILIYKEILKLTDILCEKNVQLEEIEKNIYSSKEKNSMLSLMYKTTMIKLKPEYEIYDNIFGKPQRSKNQFYNEDVINDIVKLLNTDGINFNKIKQTITNKYKFD